MDETLERLDGAAEQILRGPAPLTVERARADEVAATHRARYAAAVEMGWAPAESMPDGMERDADDRAVVLVCRDGTGIAGSARLVVPVPGRPLPTDGERSGGRGRRPRGGRAGPCGAGAGRRGPSPRRPPTDPRSA